MSSNIRVFVQWKNSTVFAGEDVECTITFRNVAPSETLERSPVQKQNGLATGGERQRKLLSAAPSISKPSISRKSSVTSFLPAPDQRSQHLAQSLYSPSVAGERRLLGSPSVASVNNVAGQRHERTISIISIGTNAGTEASNERGNQGRRPHRGHGRSASLQVTTTKSGSLPFASPGHRSGTHPSPLSGVASPSLSQGSPADIASRSGRRRPGFPASPSTPALSTTGRKASKSFSHNFKFPMSSPAENSPAEQPRRDHPVAALQIRHLSPLSPIKSRPIPTQPSIERLSSIARVLSGSSTMEDTPRSSGEFYPLSNNSNETLVSEYAANQTTKLLPRAANSRQPSLLAPPVKQGRPESLMMGYVQIMGSFTLDGSLINQAPFEEVKRKGVISSQGGGGVVGVDRMKRDSGLFGALGWANIGESLGGLLGSPEPSSIREMRGIASSKTVPLLTTPQSILFVDLKLTPGESRSYSYKFTIPRGLPPTHKGRSIKVAYNLIIGTQRAAKAREQQVRQVDVPFRVFGSVNSRGELLGHDLMSPYIILRDQAQTGSVDVSTLAKSIPTKMISNKARQDTFEDFIKYVDNLLERRQPDSSRGLLSPTGTTPGQSTIAEEPLTMKEFIDTAILRSNLTGAANQSANRFEIARSGRRVAVIMLARPAYRLGETMSAVIDFTDAHIPSYSVHISLETSEKVDSAIALRSNASIYRATKKVYASFSERALFAQKLAFSPTIPANATPEFITTGVSLEWKLRVEFVTPRLAYESGEEAVLDDLLEEVSRDDRGIILAAAQQLPAESFEVQVPLRVYGAVSGAPEALDEDGLAV